MGFECYVSLNLAFAIGLIFIYCVCFWQTFTAKKHGKDSVIKIL